jgi:hypothetical protein
MTKLQTVQNSLKEKKLLLVVGISIGGIFLLLFFNTIVDFLRPIYVSGHVPENKQITNIIKGDIIKVQFSKPVSDKDKKTLKFVTTPQINFDVLWKKPELAVLSNSYKSDVLQNATTYNVKVYKDEKLLKEWEFTTTTEEKLSDEQRFEKFARGQEALHEESQRILTERPWVEKLPIKERGYVVFWDEANESIVIQLYTRTGNYNTEDKINAARNEAIGKLEQLGIDTSKEKIDLQRLVI